MDRRTGSHAIVSRRLEPSRPATAKGVYQPRRRAPCSCAKGAHLHTLVGATSRSARPPALICRDCGSRPCACCRPDPRQPASAPGSRSRERAATLVNVDLAPGPDELGNYARCRANFSSSRLAEVRLRDAALRRHRLREVFDSYMRMPSETTASVSGGSAGGAWLHGVADWPGFLPPPHRTVHAVLPHTAHRRPSPPAFGRPRLTRQSRKGLGVTTNWSRLISPSWLREW